MQGMTGLPSATSAPSSPCVDVVSPARAVSLSGALAGMLAVAMLAAGCQPTVKVEAPDKPIVINLNVKIEQEVRVKIDRELDQAFQEDPELFQ